MDGENPQKYQNFPLNVDKWPSEKYLTSQLT